MQFYRGWCEGDEWEMECRVNKEVGEGEKRGERKREAEESVRLLDEQQS